MDPECAPNLAESESIRRHIGEALEGAGMTPDTMFKALGADFSAPGLCS